MDILKKLSDLKLNEETLMNYIHFKDLDGFAYITPNNCHFSGSQKMMRKNRIRPKTPYSLETVSVKARKSLKFD